jgi:hypothetical protein
MMINPNYWGGYYPVGAMETMEAMKRTGKEENCSMGSSQLISVDFSQPENLRIASDGEYAGLSSLVGVTDSYVVGAAYGSCQGLVFKLGEDKSLSVDKVIDFVYMTSKITENAGVLYIPCGPKGVKVVTP